MNNQSKNKLKATHIDCKIPAHDMIDVCNFDLKVTLLALGRQLADLLYQLKDDCSHISCFSWLVVCCPGGGSSIRTRSASMDDAEGVALTHDSTSLFFTTLMALAQRCCSLEAETWTPWTLDCVGWFKMWLPGSSETRHVLAWACRPFTEADLKELMEDFQFEMGVFFFFDSVHLPPGTLPFVFVSYLDERPNCWVAEYWRFVAASFAVFSCSFGCQMEYVAITQDTGLWFWPLDLAKNSGYWIVLIGGYLA